MVTQKGFLYLKSLKLITEKVKSKKDIKYTKMTSLCICYKFQKLSVFFVPSHHMGLILKNVEIDKTKL